MQPTGRRPERRDPSSDRRAGAERRHGQQPIEFDDRRTSTDRRQVARRKGTRKGEIEVFQWETEKAGLDLAKLKPILLIGVPAILLAGALICLCVVDPAPPPKNPKKPQRVLPQSVRTPRPSSPSPTAQKKGDARDAAVSKLSQDVLNIAPRIYYFVKLELEGGEDSRREEGSAEDLAFVRSIEISTRADPWDSLSSSDKVDLLHRTYNLLREKHAHTTRLTKLVFDDGRKDLELRFGTASPSER